jgi:hypothetical protein
VIRCAPQCEFGQRMKGKDVREKDGRYQDDQYGVTSQPSMNSSSRGPGGVAQMPTQIIIRIGNGGVTQATQTMFERLEMDEKRWGRVM